MNATLSRWLHSNDLKATPMANDSMWIECVSTYPPSAMGTRVRLYLTQEDVTDLLKLLKQSATVARRQNMTTFHLHEAPERNAMPQVQPTGQA